MCTLLVHCDGGDAAEEGMMPLGWGSLRHRKRVLLRVALSEVVRPLHDCRSKSFEMTESVERKRGVFPVIVS